MNKFLLSSLMAAAAAAPAVAGVDNINYQAVLKNNNVVVADQKVEMKFELLDNTNAVVYAEEQAPTTNAAGLVSVQLGGDDKLTDINWGNLKLRVSVNLGNGYEVISNEPVSSVPTALYALTTADNEEIKDAVNGLMQDMDEMKENFLGANAEIVRLDGAVEELTSGFENMGENLTMSFEAVDAKIEVVEAQIENLNNVSAVVRQNEQDIVALNESLESTFAALDTRLTKDENNLGAVEKDVEELNTNVEAMAEMLETRLEKIEKSAGDTDNDLENIKENLTLSFETVDARFTEVDAQLENLNMVAAVVRENEQAIEELNTNTEAFATMLETRLDKMQNQMDLADNTAEENYDDLKGAVERNSNMIQPLIGKVGDLEEEVAKLIQEQDNTAETMMGVNAELVKLNGVADEFAEFQEETLPKIAETTANLTTTVDENYDELKGYNERNEQAISVLQGKVGELEEEVGKLVQEQDNTAETMLGVNAELVKLNGVADEFTEFQEETLPKIAEATANLTTTVDENYDELKGYNERNEQAISVLQGKVGELEDTVADNYDDLKGSIMRNADAISVLQGKVNEDIDAVKQSSEQMASMFDAQIEKTNNNLAALEKEVEGVKVSSEGMAAMVDAQIEKTNNNLAALEKEVEGVKVGSEGMAAMVDAQIEKTNNNVDAINNEVADLTKQVKLLNSSMDEITNPTIEDSLVNRMNEGMNNLYEELMAEINKLKAELDALKAAK